MDVTDGEIDPLKVIRCVRSVNRHKRASSSFQNKVSVAAYYRSIQVEKEEAIINVPALLPAET